MLKRLLKKISAIAPRSPSLEHSNVSGKQNNAFREKYRLLGQDIRRATVNIVQDKTC